ncbi:MAG: Spx/MgsR family RNA polymerase-binding regulatory protein, partial [Bacteroidota bacterium]
VIFAPHLFCMYTIYGIPNCGTVKKAIQWFDRNGLRYQFHNFQKQGVTSVLLINWAAQVGWDSLINKNGTTWRKNKELNEKKILTEKGKTDLLTDQTSIIRRPLITKGDKVMALGFQEDHYLATFL